jgi:tetratricopeptide (TPR) repeat protein
MTAPARDALAEVAIDAQAKDASARDASADAMTIAELDRALAGLDDPTADARRAAAKSIEELDPDATKAIAAKLDAMRAENLDIPEIVKTASHEKREKGEELDLTEALAKMPPNGVAYAVALRTAALLRALAHIGTLDAMHAMLAVVPDHEGAFRPEIVRLLDKMGDRAVPGLVVARKDASPAVRKVAIAELESMNKTRAGDLIQTKSNVLLCDALRAFGIVRDVDGLPIVISFANAERASVRQAAREALGLYGADALPKLREAYSNLTGKTAPEEWDAPEAAKQLFSAYDRIRMQEVYTLLDEGLEAQRAGKLAEAIADFDKVLARQPLIDRRIELVPGYVQYAQDLEDRDRPAALAYFRKAARLDPDGPRAGQIASAIATLEGDDLRDRGIADAEIYRRALQLDPGNARARATLDKLEADAEARQERVKRWTIAGIALVVGIVVIVLFGGRKRRATS